MGARADEGPYDGYYSEREKGLLRRAATRQGIDAEIGAARVALMRLLGSGLAEEKPELVLKAVEGIVRAMRVRHQISGGPAENLLEAADKILGEFGLGDE